MAREFNRTDRVGSQMQRELAELIRDQIDDPRLGMITIQTVRVVRDFSHAKVFFTLLGGELDQKESTKLLNTAASFLRYELGRRIKLRSIPQLHFVHDDSVAHGAKLSALIDEAIESDITKHKDDE